MADIADRLLRVSIENRPALELVAKYGAHKGVLLYVDPPYLGTTRSSQGYEHEMGRIDQHVELLEALKQCKATVLLSGYFSPLYADHLPDWDVVQLQGARSQTNQPRTEVVWANRTLQQHLFSPALEVPA